MLQCLLRRSIGGSRTAYMDVIVCLYCQGMEVMQHIMMMDPMPIHLSVARDTAQFIVPWLQRLVDSL